MDKTEVIKNVWAYTYIPRTLLGDGVWGVWIFRKYRLPVLPTKSKKRKSIRKSINKKPHECGATLPRLRNFSSSFECDPMTHQMRLLNLCLILYYFEIRLLSYLLLAQHTIQLYSVLYFSYLNLSIILATKKPREWG